MPIYEYRCGNCHKIFEEWRRHIDEDVRCPCPECKNIAERIVSNTTFMLKGGGWYATDYGNRKNAEQARNEDTPQGTVPSGENKSCSSAQNASPAA